MKGKVKFSNLRPVSLLLLIFSLIYLTMIIAACSSEISAPTPALEPEKVPPAVVVEETPKETLPTSGVEYGKSLFISKACTGCHTVQGIPEAQGKVGAELTHTASNPMIAGVLPNNEESLRKWLKDPTQVKPGTLMPNQYLTDSEIEALVTFLQTLK